MLAIEVRPGDHIIWGGRVQAVVRLVTADGQWIEITPEQGQMFGVPYMQEMTDAASGSRIIVRPLRGRNYEERERRLKRALPRRGTHETFEAVVAGVVRLRAPRPCSDCGTTDRYHYAGCMVVS